ncbi:uncharacterized protein N7483_000199 [Penicillium malachiteum]|uniref:uncharacterized protein n=1 Tax=Penicillium malachiteum TaxID=1324776 RepID=UPI002547634A|nr:uncharacterized protein N7483_000199 [Penicillium malachiteum]KAJ5735074.1 hypothetical protein N7483_000199 [Penicillium malachiteum]
MARQPSSNLLDFTFPWVLIDDKALPLTEDRNSNHSFVSCTMAADDLYFDPVIEVCFECAYHLPVPAKEAGDEIYQGLDDRDERVDENGLRCSQYAYVAYMARNVKSLKVITVERTSDDNIDLQELGFSQAVTVGDRVALSEAELSSLIPKGYGQSPVHILQINVEHTQTPLVANMHIPKQLGEQNAR